jgi:hypothetical protein
MMDGASGMSCGGHFNYPFVTDCISQAPGYLS